MGKIFYPCDQCHHEGECENKRGCYQWKSWFRAYWRGLRKKYAGNHNRG